MTELSVLQDARPRRTAERRREREARRWRLLRAAVAAVLLCVVLLLGFMAAGVRGPTPATIRSQAPGTAKAATRPAAAAHPTYGALLAPAADRIGVFLKLPLRSGVLFDVRTGRVLWERNPEKVVAIASLTKMMTALVVVAHARPSESVLISKAATSYTGSGVGLLPLHKRVRLETLLYGLLLPSGNDAAIALAQHVAGTQSRFIAMMNAQAHAMGLVCTHFTSVSGIVDRGNYSCTSDLALLARAILEQPRLARIVATRDAAMPFPIKGGKLYLYNNNPLLRLRYPGTDGVKTGYTDAAGRCLVATVKRGPWWLGVVLLHSGDPAAQAQHLFNAAFMKLATARG